MSVNQSKPNQPGVRNALIAVVVVALVGVSTFYGVSYISSIQPTSSVSTTSSSALSTTNSNSVSSDQTGNTNTGSTQGSTSSNFGYQFVPVGHANVTVSGNNATLVASFSNHGTRTATANLYLTIYYANGTIFANGTLFYPNGPTVDPATDFSISDDLGPFSSPGTYSASFYVIDTSLREISTEVVVSFVISA